jgi:hypothetical protein
MTLQPHRLIEAHADLADRMRTNVDFQRLVKAQIGSLVPSPIADQRDYQAEAAYETMRGAVRGAYCYRVAPDMTTLVQHAAMMLDDTDQFDPGLAPTGCGLAYFDGGLTIVGARGEKMIINWLLWGPGYFRTLEDQTHVSPVMSGVFTAHFNDMLLQPDVIAQSILDRHGRRARATFGRWGFMGCSANPAGERLGPPETEPGIEQYLEILAEGDTPTPGTNITRLVHAFWLLLNQTITYSAPAVGMPPVVKATACKARVPGKVSVVELRRRQNVNQADHGERHVDWSHRWIVRGFWRWQHCGPGNKERKRIWIAPYIKGPEDKPLVATERVYDLKR